MQNSSKHIVRVVSKEASSYPEDTYRSPVLLEHQLPILSALRLGIHSHQHASHSVTNVLYSIFATILAGGTHVNTINKAFGSGPQSVCGSVPNGVC